MCVCVCVCVCGCECVCVCARRYLCVYNYWEGGDILMTHLCMLILCVWISLIVYVNIVCLDIAYCIC